MVIYGDDTNGQVYIVLLLCNLSESVTESVGIRIFDDFWIPEKATHG